MSPPPLRVVVAGAGIAGLEALVALRTLAGHAVDLHLVAPDEDFSLRALSVFEPFGLARPQRYAIAEIADDLAAVRHHDAIRGVRLDDREADLRSGAVLPYDALLLAVGASAYPAFEYGACFDRAHERDAFDEVLDDVRLRMARRVAIVVPASVTCKVDLSSSLNVNTNGSGACPVTLPAGTTNAPVTVTLTINNTGQADLNVNIIGGDILSSAVFDCDFLTNITFGTVFVPANAGGGDPF